MTDTVLIIRRGFSNYDKDTFELLKLSIDTNKTPDQAQKILLFNKRQLQTIIDSIVRIQYLSGNDLSEKCLHHIEHSASGIRQKKDRGYFENYSIKDVRLFENDTIYVYEKNEKYHFENSDSIKERLKAFYTPDTFIRQSRDKRLTVFCFVKRYTYFDEEGNEVVVMNWELRLK